MSAPVQVLVLGIDEPSFSGEVLDELARLREAEVVRLVGLLLVTRHQDGTFDTLEPPDGVPPELIRAATALLGGPEEGEAVGSDLDESDQTWSLEDLVAPGSVAAVALIEHTWAAPLVGAIGATGGHLLGELWLSPEDRARLASAG